MWRPLIYSKAAVSATKWRTKWIILILILTEIDFINGKFIEYGQQAGIDAPYNKMIWALVKAIEAKPRINRME